jgi:hypothetical protein
LSLKYKEIKQEIEKLEKKERTISQEIQSIIYKNTTNAVET